MNVKESLKQSVVNGQIKESQALAIGDQADQLLKEASALLDQLKRNVGMFLGGEIASLQAKIKGQRFNEAEYHHDRVPDGQD